MNIKPICCWLLLCLCTIHQCLASDTTYRKKPVYFSVSIGYTANKAFGSLPDMVSTFNEQYGITDARQKNGGGFGFTFALQKQFSEYFYYQTGLGYIQKQVNPEEGGYMLYKDSLKTGYLVIPLLFGVSSPLNAAKTIFLSMEAGPSANIKLINKTTYGQDRAGFKTLPVVLDAHIGGGFTFETSPGFRVLLHYNYMTDLSHAYNEKLYWGAPNELIRTRSYQVSTQFISLGFQWKL